MTRPGVEVVNLDALTYAGHLESLAGVLESDRHTFVHGDICDPATVRASMDGVDWVLHLAAESHVDRSIESDQAFIRTNVLGTGTLLAAALDAGVRRFVHVSTDEVYGELPWVDPGVGGGALFTEETPLSPRSPYSATKAASDLLALAYHTTHSMDVVVTRCSNNYGPFQYPEKLIPLMIDLGSKGVRLPVYGDGLHVRDWIHVEDHCRGILAAAERGRAGRVYNFGGDCERTNLDVVRQILHALGRDESLISFVEDRPGHDRRYGIDFARARKELDWEPEANFESCLRDTVEWYRSNSAWINAVRG